MPLPTKPQLEALKTLTDPRVMRWHPDGWHWVHPGVGAVLERYGWAEVKRVRNKPLGEGMPTFYTAARITEAGRMLALRPGEKP
jgi:hypothetical protein